MATESDGVTRERRDHRQSLGRRGEDLAAAALEAAGFEIVARNVRTRLGELDLIARDGRFLVFVEVKTRRTERFGSGADAVGWRKQERLRRLAAAYLGQAIESTPLRFDVVDVALRPGQAPEVRHIRDAF